MRRALLILSTLWVVVYDNSRMGNVPSKDVVQFAVFPRDLRSIETFLLVALYILLLARRTSKPVSRVNVYFICLSALSFVGLLVNGILNTSDIQDLYVRLVPFLFFVVAGKIGVTRKNLSQATKFFSVFLGLSILVAVIYQIPRYGYFEDNINGFFEDAHMFGTFLALFSIVLFADFLEYRQKVSLALSLLLFVLSIFPKNDKVIILNAAVLAALTLWYAVTRWGIPKKLVVAVVSPIVLAFAYRFLANYFLRNSGLGVDEVFSWGMQNFGPFISWPLAWADLSVSAKSLIVGLGAGQYGWLAASRAVAQGGGSYYAQAFTTEFAGKVAPSAFLFRTNTWSSLLAEYGILGFLLFVLALGSIVRQVANSQLECRFDFMMRSAFYGLLILVVYQGFFTPFSNWSESILVFPMMYIAAYFAGSTKTSPRTVATSR